MSNYLVAEQHDTSASARCCGCEGGEDSCCWRCGDEYGLCGCGSKNDEESVLATSYEPYNGQLALVPTGVAAANDNNIADSRNEKNEQRETPVTESTPPTSAQRQEQQATAKSRPRLLRKGLFFGRNRKKQSSDDQSLWWQFNRSTMVSKDDQDNAGTNLRKNRAFVGLRRLSNKEVAPNESQEIEVDASFSQTTFSFLNDLRQRQVVFHSFGSPDVNSVQETSEMPTPLSKDHVVVKVQASTVSLQDCFNRRGFSFDLFDPVCLPSSPGCDAVGHIVLRGDNVTEFDHGDRVAALLRSGGNARYANIHKDSLIKVPSSLSSIEVACMMSVYATAYQCLKMISNGSTLFSLKGKRVLVVGGMDGVGQALIQLCNKGRAEVHATAPDRRHGYIRNVLDATPLPESAAEWSVITSGDFDMVFDGVCEDGLHSSYKACKSDGKVVCFGFSSMLRNKEMGLFGAPLSAHLKKWQTLRSTVDIYDSFQTNPAQYKKNVAALFQLLKWHRIKPHIAKRVALSQVANAQAKLETGEVRGTVVCLPWRPLRGKEVVKNDE